MEDGKEWLEGLSKGMRQDIEQGAAAKPHELTVRDLLAKFRYERRGSFIVNEISNQLESLNLRTVPDFTTAWIDRTIRIELDDQATEATSPEAPSEATRRIGWLTAAHINDPPSEKFITVKRDEQLKTATTLMQLHDLSQLPVMNSNESRDVDGIISWKSIGERVAMDQPCEFVRHCMESPGQVIEIETPLFDAVDTIVQHGYVLVRSHRRITGIVTASDLSEQFRELAGPFMLLGEIEGNLRRLIHGKFTVDQMKKIAEGGGMRKSIHGSADLTLGDYCSLLGNEEGWAQVGLPASRKEFVRHLEEIRSIRNDVMHFNPDGLETTDVQALERMARFVEALHRFRPVNNSQENN